MFSVNIYASGWAKVVIKDKTLLVEVASTPEERAKGLMFRKTLDYNKGMLFVFDSPVCSGFYMKNTTIPLSIAFISEDNVIVKIENMEPLTTMTHKPDRDYLFALEVVQGWFKDNGIEVGDKVLIKYLNNR